MFNDQMHLEFFRAYCPGKLLQDSEWFSTLFILTADPELREKTLNHVDRKRREIHWDDIFNQDFGSGHRAALYWAFSLWAGNSWPKEDHTRVDTMDHDYYMDEDLRRTAVYALLLRWKMKKVEL